VTELGLIVGIDVVGLVLALLMWRGVSVRDAGTIGMQRLGSALERAARAFLWRGYRLIAVATLALVLLCAILGASVDLEATSAGRLGVALSLAVGLCLGAFGAALAGYVGTLLGLRGSVRVAAAAGTSVDGALVTAMHAAGAASLFSETLSGLLVAAFFSSLFAIRGGFALPPEQASPLASHLVWLLPGLALGASVSALVLQRAGGAFHAASGVGSDQAGERDAGLDHDDARNPAVVSELLGDHVGASATRHLDGFASACVANVAALIIGGTLSSLAPGTDPLTLVVMPLVVRAFGVIASTFGVLLVRSEETSSLPHALFRGYLSTAAVTLTALGGVSYWLFAEHFLAVFASGALGLVSTLLAAHALLLRIGRRSATLRESGEAIRVSSATLVSAGLGAGLETVLVPVVILGVSAAASVSIGVRTGFSAGAEVCVLVFTLAAFSVAPFVLAVATVGSIADGARGVARMSGADGELKRRSARLDDAGFLGAAVARQHAVFTGTLSSLLVAWAITGPHRVADGQLPMFAASATLVWCSAVGAAAVLGYAGAVARAAVRGAREVSAEVERQLRGFPREHGVAQVPLDYTPSYKSCVELTTAVSLRHALTPIAAGLAVPVFLGVGLRLSFRVIAPDLVAAGLTWFVTGAALTGLSAAVAFDAARAVLNLVRRGQRGRENPTSFAHSITADALSDIFGNAAAPALQLLVKATAAAALIITPFLI